VYDKNGAVVTTAVTNLDIHDIARLARTYNCPGYYILNPIRDQSVLVQKIINHWSQGYGKTYNPIRGEALELVKVLPDIESVIDDVHAITGKKPLLVATTAKEMKNAVDYCEIGPKLSTSGSQPYLLLFGTGWGMSVEMLETCDYVLKPINPGTDYNHLSVRSAASIILDRLFSV